MKRGVYVPLAIGVVASVLTLAGAVVDPRRALLGWIAAYGLAAATVLAAAILVMTLHVTGARWWLVLRDVFHAIVGTTPLLVLLFVPIGAAYSLAYPWATAPASLPASQRTWNEPTFFLARAAVYLMTWTTLAALLCRTERPERLRTISAIGLPVVAFTLTFAAFDWLMSLQPGWSSNVYGVYVFTSGLIAALSLVAIGAWARQGASPDHVSAVGRLLLTAVILWTYIGFFQLLLVWIADLPQESTFYAARSHGVWAGVGVVLGVGRFVLPFLALLSRPLKRSPRLLAAVGVWLLATSIVDFTWLALPSGGVELTPARLLPFLGVGGLFWAYGAHRLARGATAPFPARPVIEDALRYRSP